MICYQESPSPKLLEPCVPPELLTWQISMGSSCLLLFLRLLSGYGLFNNHRNLFEQLPHHTFVAFLIDVFPPFIRFLPYPHDAEEAEG